MPQYDIPSSQEMIRSQKVTEAVATLDEYDSPRAKEANREMTRNGCSSKIITLPDRAMTFFGSRHTSDSESPTVQDLLRDLQEYCSEIDPADMMFMIEGRHGGMDGKEAMSGVSTIEEAVKKYGESGIALWYVADYAKQGVNVEISSPEAPEEVIVTSVRRDFSAEDIASYLVLRQWTTELGGRRSGEYPVIDIARQMYHFAELSGVEWIRDKRTDAELRAMLDLPEVLHAYAETVVKQFLSGLNAKFGLTITLRQLVERNPGDVVMKEINELSDPMDHMGRGTAINAVAARWNGERDKFLVQSIGRAMISGKKPYVIFGASHAVHCEPALKKLAELAK